MLLRVVLFSFLLLLVSPAAHAGKRVALVIGNSSYRYAGELANPKNDATDIAAALRAHGFQVVEGLDLNKTGLERKIREFAVALQGAEVGVFFYAGHGLQVSGQNYIVPTDAQLTSLAALELEVMRFEAVQRIMENEDRTNILFFDACRDNPLARNLQQAMGTRSTAIGRGLAEIQTGQGTLISYSTAPGNVALDGAGRNSPFTGALIRHLSSSNEEIMGLLRDVRNDVLRETQRRQRPWESSGLTERFYFSGPPNANLPAPVRPQANLSAPVRPANQAERAGALAAAKELVAAKGANAFYGPIIPGIIEQAKSVLLEKNPQLDKDLNEVAAKLRTEYAARTTEIVDDGPARYHAELYAARFKEQELKGALAFYKTPVGRHALLGTPDKNIAFYKTPLGRKLLAEEPRILDESMTHAQSWANRLAEEIISKMRAEMKKRGNDI